MTAQKRQRLLIFTRYPEPGKTKTRLIPLLGAQGAAELQRQMTELIIVKTSELCAWPSLSVEVGYEGGNEILMREWLGPRLSYRPQSLGDLGQRMASGFEEGFLSGIDVAVIIGTDVPGITTDIIQNAFAELKENDLVIGPARDGGYYLIGMGPTTFSRANPRLFNEINWGSENVLSQTLQIAKGLGLRVSLLDTLDDVDRPKDLPVWEHAKKGEPKPTRSRDISIIIPALNEAPSIPKTLSNLKHGDNLEVIVVDGGSEDNTADLARSLGAKVITTSAGKAVQMNAGASAANGEVIMFLHADTRLPANFEKLILHTVQQNGATAGAFRLKIDSDARGLRLIEKVAYLRSRFLQMPYGDQGIFLTKTIFNEIGGFPDLPIMEDFVLIRRLKRKGKIIILPQCVLTSPRRWIQMGIFKTWLINQLIIIAYYLGIPPKRLASWYRREKGKSKK
jgi:rSAM/selenodomain-associated transferase 2/rSAM/selenodomain-associated transferase 1